MDHFIGSVMLWPAGLVPKGWALCDGRMMSVPDNKALFSILGTTYGGDGQNTFALPDFRGRVPMGSSNANPPGTYGGTDVVTLTAPNMPVHSHALNVSTQSGTTTSFTNVVLGSAGTAPNTSTPPNIYGEPGSGNPPLADTSVVPGPMAQPHDNMQPYLALNYLIALTGIYPSKP